MLKLKFQYFGHLMQRANSWGQEEKEATEGDKVGWHHQLNGHVSEQAPGDSEGQGSLACCNPWGRKESDMAERLNNNRVTEREEKQNSKIAQMENWVNQHLPEKTGGWKWRGRGVAKGSSPGRLLRLPSSEGLCVRGEGVWWTQGVLAGWRTKKGKGKGKGASTFQGDLVERIQNWIGSNHWWFILRKSQRGSFPSFPPPVSALGISQAKRAAQFESLSLRNQEMITWNRSTSLLRTVNPVFTRILLAIVYLQSNLNSCKSIYCGTPEVFLSFFLLHYIFQLRMIRGLPRKKWQTEILITYVCCSLPGTRSRSSSWEAAKYFNRAISLEHQYNFTSIWLRITVIIFECLVYSRHLTYIISFISQKNPMR